MIVMMMENLMMSRNIKLLSNEQFKKVCYNINGNNILKKEEMRMRIW